MSTSLVKETPQERVFSEKGKDAGRQVPKGGCHSSQSQTTKQHLPQNSEARDESMQEVAFQMIAIKVGLDQGSNNKKGV